MKPTTKFDRLLESRRFWLVPLLAYCIYAFKELSLPGLYMDAANPDYHAAWLGRGLHQMPAWIYPDNIIFGEFRMPLLNSLYGGNPTAYLAAAFFGFFGFGLGEVRLFHALLGLSLIAAWIQALRVWRAGAFASALALSWLALDPTFLLAWRTQYYLQLFPAIFMALGLTQLGRHFHQPQSNRSGHHLWWAGGWLGFAGYGYFIFVIYAFVIICVYTHALKKSRPQRVFWPLCGGTAIGVFPYVYAHFSILLNVGASGYLDMLRGLQGAYGVVNVDQGGWMRRLSVVVHKLDLLLAGKGVGIMMFGDLTEPAGMSAFKAILLTIAVSSCLALVLKRRLSEKFASDGLPVNASPALLLRLLFTMMLAHMGFGLALGEPLQMQHYVMLLPIVAAMFAVTWTVVAARASPGNLRCMGAAMVVVVGVAMALNVFLCSNVFERLKSEGGNGLYSDVINIAAAHLSTQGAESALLFPQWGYWMGMSTIIGPRMSMYETPSLDAMTARMKQDTALIEHRDVTLVLGHEVMDLSLPAIDAKVAQFAQETGLNVLDRIVVHGRNGRDRIVLVRMKRGVR